MNVRWKNIKIPLLMGLIISSVGIHATPIPSESEYAYIYNTNVQPIKLGEAATFDSHGPISSGIQHTPGTSAIVFKSRGVYSVSFYVLGNQRTSFGLFLNDVLVDGGLYGTFKWEDITLTGQSIIKSEAGSVLTLKYHNPQMLLPGAVPPDNVQIHGYSKGGFVNASIVITKVG
ncbi:MAG TPA: hypothetical protein VGW78_00285 [Candidatus Babeliales bacterium]|jgi:hypothetical protein|nr:hypothetical protein [Candidatus Babeliales bacterium]